MKTEDTDRLKNEINKTIDTVNETLEKLKSRQAEMTGEVRKEIDARIEVLESRRKELLARSKELGKSAGEAVRDISDGMRFALKELEEGVSRAWRDFRG